MESHPDLLSNLLFGVVPDRAPRPLSPPFSQIYVELHRESEESSRKGFGFHGERRSLD